MITKNEKKFGKLLKTIQYMRLVFINNLIDKQIEKKQLIEGNQNDGFLKNLGTSISNSLNKRPLDKLNEKKEKITTILNGFKTIEIYKNDDEMLKAIQTLFKDDVYNLEKTLFSLNVIFDNEFNYEYEKESLNHISSILWDEKTYLLNLKSEIEEIYMDIAKQPLSTRQKVILGGVIAGAALTIFSLGTSTLGALSASTFTTTLATIGGTMAGGVSAYATTAVLLTGFIGVTTYVAMNEHNKRVLRKEFREMKYEEVAILMSIRAYMMKITKTRMPLDLYKEKTDELLRMVQDIRSDTEYSLFVERNDIEENKKKIKVFHNLDYKLTNIIFG